ncbi:YbaB/EbfC family nucleoid-associated protein [Nocardia elegans]|uniref:YbaB/EbfC family nucleoid-associated protein n=1 Tax=Nocardia elegans TaxID=300029 RepID=UPI001896030C|nr:YbaB/EbfC family nucleoid-associated protein [Nocardia elegans]MBF6247187.1 YbaB/EbfC family nucleoid-associated protein [Nocardia elegans]
MYETMDELEAAVRTRLYRLRALAEDMSGVRASATSADGAITVEVDGNGTLLNLTFKQGISTMSPAEFEQALVSTSTAAAAAAFAQRADLVTAFNEEVAG